MKFCPHCHNVLIVGKSDPKASNVDELPFRMFCFTCPYIYTISTEIRRYVPLTAKKIDDILGDESWEAAAKTRVLCPECDNNEAYFLQIQTRSADEPSTIFYKCTKCDHRWKEN